MKVLCKACRLPIPSQDINLEMAIAKCPACGEVFSFLEQLGGEARAPVPTSRLPAPKPARFIVEEFGSELTISYRWFSPVSLFMVFFCLFWDGFMAVWYTIAIWEIVNGQPMAWIMAAFGLVHLGVGVFITYSTFASFVNRTVIHVSGGNLTVRHGPLRWWGNQTLAVSDIKQFYCSEQITRGSNDEGWQQRGRWNYQLNALVQGNTKVTLVSGLREPEEALFLEERLEQKLGIPPQQVPGEMRS